MSERKPATSQLICFSLYCPDTKTEITRGVIETHKIVTNPEQGLFFAKDESNKILSQGTIFEGICDINTYLMLQNVLTKYVFKNSPDQFSRVTPLSEMEKLY